MGLKIIIRTKFNATKQMIEKIWDNKYLVHLTFPEDKDSTLVLKEILSRHLGVPASKIEFKGLDIYKDKIFEVL